MSETILIIYRRHAFKETLVGCWSTRFRVLRTTLTPAGTPVATAGCPTHICGGGGEELSPLLGQEVSVAVAVAARTEPLVVDRGGVRVLTGSALVLGMGILRPAMDSEDLPVEVDESLIGGSWAVGHAERREERARGPSYRGFVFRQRLGCAF